MNSFLFGLISQNRAPVAPSSGPTLVKSEDFSAVAGSGTTQNLTVITGWTSELNTINVWDQGGSDQTALGGSSSAHSLYRWADGTTSLDQFVEVVFDVASAAWFGAAARVQAGSADGYVLYYNGSVGQTIRLGKIIAGALTSMVTASAVTCTKLRLTVSGSGSATRLTAERFDSGSWQSIPTMTNYDPGDYLGAGYGGLYSFNNNTGIRINQFDWYDI